MTQVAGTCAPAALTSVQASPVSDQRSSPGSVSVTVTVLPLVSDRVSDPPVVSEKVPFDHGEPASVDEDVKVERACGWCGTGDRLDDRQGAFLDQRRVQAGVCLRALDRAELVLRGAAGVVGHVVVDDATGMKPRMTRRKFNPPCVKRDRRDLIGEGDQIVAAVVAAAVGRLVELPVEADRVGRGESTKDGTDPPVK